jgi:adenosylmethionine-8-amino-7-oxononanoate aminotransferase
VCAAGLANIEILEREHLIPRGRELEGVLIDALKPLENHPLVGEVRGGVGLMASIAISDALFEQDRNLPAKVVAACRPHGVVARQLVREIACSPPLIITPAEIGEIADGFRAGLDDLLEHSDVHALLAAAG